MSDPYQVVRDFEAALCEYTGAKYAVTTNSCTMALLLAVKWCSKDFNPIDEEKFDLFIPKKTYVSVPQSIIHAGCNVYFEDCEWLGQYELIPAAALAWPNSVWDSARRFTSGMYQPGAFQCVSFHASKILGDTQGGAILHDNPEADEWFRRARFDGRKEGVAPKDDTFDMVGWHCYMSPDVAARLLLKLSVLPKYNPDLPNDDYPDLSTIKAFK